MLVDWTYAAVVYTLRAGVHQTETYAVNGVPRCPLTHLSEHALLVRPAKPAATSGQQ